MKKKNRQQEHTGAFRTPLPSFHRPSVSCHCRNPLQDSEHPHTWLTSSGGTAWRRAYSSFLAALSVLGAGEGVRETGVGSQVPALLLHTLIARQSLISPYPGAPPGCQPPHRQPQVSICSKGPFPCQNYLSNFPGGPVFKNPPNAGSHRFDPGWGKMPHALETKPI